jgi:hypothetical protein
MASFFVVHDPLKESKTIPDKPPTPWQSGHPNGPKDKFLWQRMNCLE